MERLILDRRAHADRANAARHVHVMRQLVGRLRAGIDVDPELQAMLSWDELIQLATARTRVDADLQQRQRELDVRARPSARPPLAIRRYAVLTGVAASSGCTEGTAVVVHDPSVDDLDGDILVAHATDTAWTPLFLGRAGVVTDTGGVLSHSSIVARDLGIPAVVGTGTATQVIRSGDVTRVNGDDGVVEIVAT